MTVDDDAKSMTELVWSYWHQKGWTKPKMTWIELFQVCRFYLEECRRRGIDPQEFSLRDELDAQIGYHENKAGIEELLRSKPSAEPSLEEASAFIEEELNRLVAGTEYAVVTKDEKEKLQDLEQKIDRLREQTRRLKAQKDQRERETAIALEKAKEWEAEARRKPVMKIRILDNFREGIQYFKRGEVVETQNFEWALSRIEQGLAERVSTEVPVKILPEKPKVEARARAPVKEDEIRQLTDLFITILSRSQVSIRPEYRSRFRVELPTILQAATREEKEKLTEQFALEIVNEYKARVDTARRVREGLPSTVKEIPPDWKTTKGGWILPNGRFIPFGKGEENAKVVKAVEEYTPPKLEPPAAGLWRWLYDTFKLGAVEYFDYDTGKTEKGFKNLKEIERAFYALPKDEQDALIQQYRKHLPSFKYPDMATFLKEKYSMTMDDLAKADNEEKIRLWNEFWGEKEN